MFWCHELCKNYLTHEWQSKTLVQFKSYGHFSPENVCNPISVLPYGIHFIRKYSGRQRKQENHFGLCRTDALTICNFKETKRSLCVAVVNHTSRVLLPTCLPRFWYSYGATRNTYHLRVLGNCKQYIPKHFSYRRNQHVFAKQNSAIY